MIREDIQRQTVGSSCHSLNPAIIRRLMTPGEIADTVITEEDAVGAAPEVGKGISYCAGEDGISGKLVGAGLDLDLMATGGDQKAVGNLVIPLRQLENS